MVPVKMSILKYFQRKQPRDSGEFLPEASNSSPLLSEHSITSANEEVRVITTDTIAPMSKRQKTEQHFYSEEVHASIGKYASVHGPTAASREFSKKVSHRIPESTA